MSGRSSCLSAAMMTIFGKILDYGFTDGEFGFAL
jgi:hypothetical protein